MNVQGIPCQISDCEGMTEGLSRFCPECQRDVANRLYASGNESRESIEATLFWPGEEE